MPVIEPAGQKIARNLQDAIRRLQDDIARVEMWADALGCFSQPIPNYDPNTQDLKSVALRRGATARGDASASRKSGSRAERAAG